MVKTGTCPALRNPAWSSFHANARNRAGGTDNKCYSVNSVCTALCSCRGSVMSYD